jgi:dTDP-4-dehydrorhamnose 3,5-epimerase
MLRPQRDAQTVTPAGDLVRPLLDGVIVRPAVTIADDRGELCEIFNPAWQLDDQPLVYVYQATIRPGKVKGWVVHREQDDRLFSSMGHLKIVLYDDRADSASYQRINEIFVGERNRALVLIPRGIYHAVQNIGQTEAVFMNLPSRPYQHDHPDKYRLPLDTDLIPYSFAPTVGG